MTSKEIIQARVRKSFANKAIKDAAYRHRRYSIGDEIAIGGTQGTAGFDDLLRLKKSNPQYPLYRLAVHHKGVINPQLLWLAVIIDTVSINKPSVFFPTLSPQVSKFREAWIQDKLIDADWSAHQTRFLYSFLVDGLSFLKAGYWDDRLGVRSVDTLNMFWDLNPDLPSESQWVAEYICISTNQAIKMMGREAASQLTNKELDPTGEERLMCLEYWDYNTVAYLMPNGSKVLKTKRNPYGCVPYECFFGDMYPSLYAPIPHIARTISIGTAISEISRTVMERIRTGRPIMEISSEAYTPESMDRFADADGDVTYMERAKSENGEPTGPGISYASGPDISAELVNLLKFYEEKAVSMYGVNPYSAGYQPQADFAAQVIAVQNNSSLTTTRIAEEYTTVLGRTFRKLCKIGAKFDDSEFETNIGGNAYSFGPHFSIAPVLEQDVNCYVSPSTQDNPMVREVKLSQLWAMLTPELRARYPKVEQELLSIKLLDAGLHDVEALLEPAQPELAAMPEDIAQMMQGQGDMPHAA